MSTQRAPRPHWGHYIDVRLQGDGDFRVYYSAVDGTARLVTRLISDATSATGYRLREIAMHSRVATLALRAGELAIAEGAGAEGARAGARYENDLQFEEVRIKSVSREGNDGWSIQREDGWSFYVPRVHGVEPKSGMLARFYGRGVGFTVRGLLLDGEYVFYRTESDDTRFRELEMYGADAAEWLARWDAGKTCWTIEMGGMGPGYEQCIHIACAEMLRHMLGAKYDSVAWVDLDAWDRYRKAIDRAISDNEIVSRLGLSGAQYGAALNLAVQFYRRGPRDVMTDPAVKDRHIQVRKNFPRAEL